MNKTVTGYQGYPYPYPGISRRPYPVVVIVCYLSKDMVLTSISSRCSRVKKNLNAAKPPEQSKCLVGGLLDVASVLSRFGSLLVSVAGVVTMF